LDWGLGHLAIWFPTGWVGLESSEEERTRDTVKNPRRCILFATTCNTHLKNFSGMGKKGEADG
jgi:hypothetical protein